MARTRARKERENEEEEVAITPEEQKVKAKKKKTPEEKEAKRIRRQQRVAEQEEVQEVVEDVATAVEEGDTQEPEVQNSVAVGLIEADISLNHYYQTFNHITVHQECRLGILIVNNYIR
ncbi:MAG: hypothetical protein Q8835_03245, partial [Sweet potato little leaf phytoplasma]|nr:hypothetical protein [Sweet potato little leaf phytoplasma]